MARELEAKRKREAEAQAAQDEEAAHRAAVDAAAQGRSPVHTPNPDGKEKPDRIMTRREAERQRALSEEKLQRMKDDEVPYPPTHPHELKTG